MGFNIGAAKSRVAWTGDVQRYYFESPLVRLMSDHKYEDVFVEGDDTVLTNLGNHAVPYRCIVIYRYYDEASEDFGNDDETPPIEHFAAGLSKLIDRLRKKIVDNPDNDVGPDEFRVHLVAHSMGGLICRAFLQNPALGSATARAAVDKLFTYATPHNGIDLRIVRNIPGWLSFGDVNNFNRQKMARYLGLDDAADVAQVRGFPPERIFNLIGTNHRDYAVAGGLSAWAASEASDGLVRIENAATHGFAADGTEISSPRVFVHRSHSGQYGIVNSEEGYQNLTRFLFGKVRVDGVLHIDAISLPPELQALAHHSVVNASYQFEVVVSVRGCQWHLTQREVRDNSAIFRQYEQLFRRSPGGMPIPVRSQSPHLFSVFLDPSKSVQAERLLLNDLGFLQRL